MTADYADDFHSGLCVCVFASALKLVTSNVVSE